MFRRQTNAVNGLWIWFRMDVLIQSHVSDMVYNEVYAVSRPNWDHVMDTTLIRVLREFPHA